MKKILLVDSFTHTFLKEELKNFRIELISEENVKRDSRKFDAVIFVIREKKEIFNISKNINIFSNNIIVMTYDIDDTLVKYCRSIGIIDVIKTPYNPIYVAKRIDNLINGSHHEDKEEEGNIHKVLSRYIKSAYRRKQSLAFIGCKFLKIYDKHVFNNDILKVMKDNLRDIDYISLHNDNIIIVLPDIHQSQVKLVIERIREKINCCPLFMDYLIKERISLYNVISSTKKDLTKLENLLEKGVIIDRELIAQNIIHNQLYNLYSKIV